MATTVTTQCAVQIVETTESITATTARFGVVAQCPAGMTAIGGGGDIPDNVTDKFALVRSAPFMGDDTYNRWSVQWESKSGQAETTNFTAAAYVVCIGPAGS